LTLAALTKGASEPDETGIADFVKSLETNDRRRCLGDASPEERMPEAMPDSAQRGAESKGTSDCLSKGSGIEEKTILPKRT